MKQPTDEEIQSLFFERNGQICISCYSCAILTLHKVSFSNACVICQCKDVDCSVSAHPSKNCTVKICNYFRCEQCESGISCYIHGFEKCPFSVFSEAQTIGFAGFTKCIPIHCNVVYVSRNFSLISTVTDSMDSDSIYTKTFDFGDCLVVFARKLVDSTVCLSDLSYVYAESYVDLSFNRVNIEKESDNV